MLVIDAMPGFTFGCDPELFVVNPDGKFVSAEGLIPGTKEEPFKVNKGAIQVDGMAAEFNIDPVDNFDDFDTNILTVMKELKRHLPKGFSLKAVPAVTFDPDVWEKSPEKAKELGCTPDFNAWTGEVNPPPSNPENPYLRTASGHLHIGWTEDEDMSSLQHILNCRDLVKQFDYYLGAWSLKSDSDPTRRLLYGKAGACRYKPYGVEYRVLSNFWLTSKETRRDVWNRMQAGIKGMANRFLPEVAVRNFNTNMNDWLVTSINTSERNPLIERHFRFPVMTLERK